MGTGEAMRVQRWVGAPGAESPPTADELAERLRAEGYRVYEWTDPPGARYETHTHTSDQSHWVLRGKLAMEVGGREHVLGPGDRDWLPAGTPHSAYVVGADPVTYLVGERSNAR